MSLDNTSHPGRPGLDELVPSRYALKVGEIDVMVVSDGVLSLPGAMLGHNADPAVRAAWLEDMFLPPDVLEWALNVVVVRSGGRTILIDAGLGVDPDLDLPRAGKLAQRLQAAGIDLASVTDVVLTHLHMDHIGGLLVDGVRDRLRPDLRVHLAAAETEFWASPDFSRVSMPRGFPDALRRAAKRFLNEYRSQMRPFEAWPCPEASRRDIATTPRPEPARTRRHCPASPLHRRPCAGARPRPRCTPRRARTPAFRASSSPGPRRGPRRLRRSHAPSWAGSARSPTVAAAAPRPRRSGAPRPRAPGRLPSPSPSGTSNWARRARGRPG